MASKIMVFLTLLSVVLINVPVAPAEENGNGKKIYMSYCSGCHGASGKGDGPAAKSLTAKPADHTNRKLMNGYSDQYLFTVIAKGGSAVGKSAAMPAWAGVLNEASIKEVVVYLRTLTDSTQNAAKR